MEMKRLAGSQRLLNEVYRQFKKKLVGWSEFANSNKFMEYKKSLGLLTGLFLWSKNGV
jgi:hypothetical protein